MSLANARIPYTYVSRSLLDPVVTKADLVTAIQIYRDKTTSILGSDPKDLRRFLSRHETRYLTETTNRLLSLGAIRHGDDGFVWVDPAEESISIPSVLNYNVFSLVASKTYFALLSLCKAAARNAFVVQADLETLADEAGISPRGVRNGLDELRDRRLLRSVKHARRSTEYFLLDPRPGSLGWDLGDLVRAHRQRLDNLPIHDRYTRLLHRYDPHEMLSHGPVDGVRVLCPLCEAGKCKAGKRTKPSFYVNTQIMSMDPFEQNDSWACAVCRRSGDSARLWSKLERWADNPVGMPAIEPGPNSTEWETRAKVHAQAPAEPEQDEQEETESPSFSDAESYFSNMWREE